ADQHLADLFEAVFDVARLIPMAVAREHEFPFGRESRRELRQEPFANRFRQAWGLRRAPPHDRFGVDLVDVLSAGPGAADERELKLLARDANMRGDDEHEWKTFANDGERRPAGERAT